MHPYLKKILETGYIIDEEGKKYILNSHISLEEGVYIQEIIRNIKPKVSLEVGLAMGISTMFICEALKEINGDKHIVIDPGQVKKAYSGDNWSGLGLYNISKCGYQTIVDFKDEPSEIILSEMLKQGMKIDFAFIDGWHTFDHVLLDFFYINRMLNIGGVVVFDDSNISSINKAINYIRNYPAYIPYNIDKEIGNFNQIAKSKWPNILNKIAKNPLHYPFIILRNLVSHFCFRVKGFCSRKILGMKRNIIVSQRYYALQKVSDDCRSWDWFQNF
jgi:predicted O-methyltransferase YrrM